MSHGFSFFGAAREPMSLEEKLRFLQRKVARYDSAERPKFNFSAFVDGSTASCRLVVAETAADESTTTVAPAPGRGGRTKEDRRRRAVSLAARRNDAPVVAFLETYFGFGSASPWRCEHVRWRAAPATTSRRIYCVRAPAPVRRVGAGRRRGVRDRGRGGVGASASA